LRPAGRTAPDADIDDDRRSGVAALRADNLDVRLDLERGLQDRRGVEALPTRTSRMLPGATGRSNSTKFWTRVGRFRAHAADSTVPG